MEIYDIIEAVAATSSKNEKVAILTEHKDSSLLRLVLMKALDPNINYWIKKIPQYTKSDGPIYSIMEGLGQIQYISSRKITGDDAIDLLVNVLSRLDEKDAEILKRVILRDLRAGFAASTVNKVWKGLIPETPYCRCSLPKELGKNGLSTWPWKNGVIAQLKADGMYAAITHHVDSEIIIASRSGSIFDNKLFQPIFIEELTKAIPLGKQFQGEFLIRVNDKHLIREESNGFMNSLLKGTELPSGHFLEYHAWDVIDIVDAVPGGKVSTPYIDRFQDLRTCLTYCDDGEIKDLYTYVKPIEFQFVKSYDEALEYYSEVLSRGLEGLVLKHPDFLWADTTSRQQVKMKLTFEVELKVVGKNEGKGKYAGMLGSYQCESEDGLLKVNVAGFTDKQRKELWEDDSVSIISVTANNLTKNGDVYSLFLPVLNEVRLDKVSADTLERIVSIYESAIRPK